MPFKKTHKRVIAVFSPKGGGRLLYAGVTCLIILLGLGSRQISWVPIWTGDLLWASMVYFMFRFIFPVGSGSQSRVLAGAFLFCFLIEFSQLYQADWINRLRQTLAGKLILGSTFLWGDLLAYTAGIALALLADRLLTAAPTTRGPGRHPIS